MRAGVCVITINKCRVGAEVSVHYIILLDTRSAREESCTQNVYGIMHLTGTGGCDIIGVEPKRGKFL